MCPSFIFKAGHATSSSTSAAESAESDTLFHHLFSSLAPSPTLPVIRTPVNTLGQSGQKRRTSSSQKPYFNHRKIPFCRAQQQQHHLGVGVWTTLRTTILTTTLGRKEQQAEPEDFLPGPLLTMGLYLMGLILKNTSPDPIEIPRMFDSAVGISKWWWRFTSFDSVTRAVRDKGEYPRTSLDLRFFVPY